MLFQINKHIAEREIKMAKTYYIIGNSIDKSLFEQVKNYISHDKHISLLFIRSWIMVLRSIALLAAMIIMFIVGNWGLNISLSILSIMTVISFIGDFREIAEKYLDIRKYIGFFSPFNRKRPRHPLDIWRFYQGSVVDTQMLMTAREIAGQEIGVIYAGTPYYDTIFLDSLFLIWNGSFKDRLMKYWDYFLYTMRYSKDCIIAHAGNEVFKDGCNRVAYSNSVFGILYSSGYFFSALTKKRKGKPVRINIDLTVQNLTPEVETKRLRLVKEWIYYCISPEYVEIIDKNVENADFTVTDLLTNREVLNQKKTSHKRRLREIVLPIKRFIALENNKKDELPVPDVVSRDGSDIIIVGGAEQNLALQCIVNRYKQQNCKHGQMDLGFAENWFETAGENGFLLGTEGLVYGVSENLFRRTQKEQGASCQTVLFSMKFLNMNILSVYGFSAFATKISLCTTVYVLSKNINSISKDILERIEQAVPGFRVSVRDLIFYEIGDKIFVLDREPYIDKEIQLFQTEIGKAWDSNDLMNNTKVLIDFINNNLKV